MAPHTWTILERHCLHILATHYPDSIWSDRAAIYNAVFNTSLTPNQVRDEYGGHKAGQRNRPSNLKPTRSIQWHDHVCRDEFGLAGPFNQQQQVDRGTILAQIQAAITSLGLTANTGLSGVRMIAGMVRADTTLAPGPVPVAAPAATPTKSAAGSSAAWAGNTNTAGGEGEDDGEKDEESDGESDPALGGCMYYHTRELQREGRQMVYRPVLGLPYEEELPQTTWARNVLFPATGEVVRLQVCDMPTCPVCGARPC